MNKWEYCMIGPISAFFGPARAGDFPTINYLTDTGVQQPAQYNLRQLDNDPFHCMAQLIWLLGEEGWEMVGSGSGTVVLTPVAEGEKGEAQVGHMLYFKRLKPIV